MSIYHYNSRLVERMQHDVETALKRGRLPPTNSPDTMAFYAHEENGRTYRSDIRIASFWAEGSPYALYCQPLADDEHTHITGHAMFVFAADPVKFIGGFNDYIAESSSKCNREMDSRSIFAAKLKEYEPGSAGARAAQHFMQAAHDALSHESIFQQRLFQAERALYDARGMKWDELAKISTYPDLKI